MSSFAAVAVQETPKVPTELVSGEPTVLRHALPASGVIYTDVAFDLSRVPEELIPLVPLFTRAAEAAGDRVLPGFGGQIWGYDWFNCLGLGFIGDTIVVSV